MAERAAQRDPDAIASLYDLYAAKIYSYIYHRLSDPDVAEDLTAQVFLRMMEAIGTDRGWHSSFSGWLYRIAHNMVIDYYRKRGKASIGALEESPTIVDKRGDPYASAAASYDNEVLMRAMHSLTEEQVQVLSLRFYEGYSISEVATMLDKTDGAIKALQYRAVASLRRLIGEQP